MKVYTAMNKILSIVIATLMLLSVVSICNPSISNDVAADSGYFKWSGYSTYLKGSGVEDDPFLISSPSDLAYFRKQVAATDGMITFYTNNDTSTAAKTKVADSAVYKLTCDIYYNDPNGDEWKSWSKTVTPTNGGDSHHTWAPPGYDDESTRRFEGHFDGNGFTIYGLYIVHADKNCVGFLGSARYATIENLTLSKGFVSGANLVGGFVGQARAGFDIVNCVSYLRVRGVTGVGGFVGGNAYNGTSVATDVDVLKESTVPSFVAYNCKNTASISGTSYVGGIVGFISAGASRAQIYKCTNSAKITATTSSAGGIVGGTRQIDGYGHNTVASCTNTGNIVGGTNYYTGGIVGCGRATDIYSCINKGAVSNNGASYTGGISGGVNSGDALCNSKIQSCYNSGSVTGSSYTGGIVGVAKSLNVNMCANIADVKGTSYVGGISGRSGGSSDKRDTELYDCYNIGNVSTTDASVSVAGIVGEAFCEGTVTDNKYVKVKRCINLGAVSSGRAIAYTSSTLKNSEGTGLFVYTMYDDTCFGVSGINSNFDGGTKVNSLVDNNILNTLNAEATDTWLAGYPFPMLRKIDYSVQNHNSMQSIITNIAVNAVSADTLNVNFTVDISNPYYTDVMSYGLNYGVVAVKSDDLAEEELIVQHPSARVFDAVGNGSTYTADFVKSEGDEYDDCFVFRPYISFTLNDQCVYVYGSTVKDSFYTACGATEIAAINESAAFTCESDMYLLVGGSDTIDYSLSSASCEDSLSFVSSDTSVATVNKGKVIGVSEGKATISVTYTGAWGAKTMHCNVTVMNDLSDIVYANIYAKRDNNLRLHTNELYQIHTSITKNDGFVIDFNGSVFLVDGGNKNDKSLQYLKKLRKEFLESGLNSGELTEAEYHQRLLSDNCKLEIVSLITHWHSDHINALRFYISKSKQIVFKSIYTVADPVGTTADGYDNYILAFQKLTDSVLEYSPNVEIVRLAYEKSVTKYVDDYNNLTSTSSDATKLKIHFLTSKDWSKVSGLAADATAWENCSSTWYVFELGENKLLFTGDTYPNDVGTTYTVATTSGSTAVDYMLYKHKNVVDDSIDFVDCNHHGRSSYVENLFTVTQPSIVFAGVYYGQENVVFTDKAVESGDFYLGGDGAHTFKFDESGGIDTSEAICAYSKNSNGRAIRNYLSIHYDYEIVENEITEKLTPALGISLSKDTLWVTVGLKKQLIATVDGDSNTDKTVEWTIDNDKAISTDGAFVSAKQTGTYTITATSGSCTTSCTVNVVLSGDVNVDNMLSALDYIVLKRIIIDAQPESDYLLAVGDINFDGFISAFDYIALKQKLTRK